jgi:N6-adenosine-specific RNA methylase IME4
MWSTSNFLPDALWLMQALRFEYKTSAAWVKIRNEFSFKEPELYDTVNELAGDHLQIGLGQYMRHAHEWLLLGTRGDAMVPEPADRMPSVIFAPRTRHSEKPQEAYTLIERASPGPRLEIFAREPRDGWTVWGNEITTHGERQTK